MESPYPNPIHPPGEPTLGNLIETTVGAKAAMGKPVDFMTPMRERALARVGSLLKVEGLPEQEIVGPSDHQLMFMVDGVLHRVAEVGGIEPGDMVEPDILSVQVGVAASRNQNLLDREDPFHVATDARTFRGEAGDVTTVTIRYSHDEDDDRVFTDQYGIREVPIAGLPQLIDGHRYEGRRSFPEVASVLEKIYQGDFTGAMQDLPTIREGRRGYVFRNLRDGLDGLDDADSQEQIGNTIKFLIQGVKQKVFSIEELADIFAWPVSNPFRDKNNPRYAVCRRLPEYPEVVSMLKTLVVPQDENGSNIRAHGVDALPWVMDATTLSDGEFQQVAGVLQKWIATLNDPDYVERARTLGEGLIVKADNLVRTFPHLALTENQKQIALQTLEGLRGSRLFSEDAERGIAYLTSQTPPT